MPSDAIWAWSIIVVATACVIIRPFRLPEAVWGRDRRERAGAARPTAMAGRAPGIEKGLDVYLFLIGMMLIAELARSRPVRLSGALAVEYAAGSPQRLFLMIYLVGRW